MINLSSSLLFTGISVFALGIGDEINQAELEGIANPPNENLTFSFNVESFEALNMITSMLVAAACDAIVCKFPTVL